MTATPLSWFRDRIRGIGGPEEGREWFFVVGFVGALAFLAIAILGPAVAPYPVDERAGQPFEPPGDDHLLGTDDVGHDIFSLVLVGARVSLVVGLTSGSIALLVGLAVGVTAGVVGGRVERLLMRIVDVVLTLPFLPLVIVAAAVLGPSLWTTIGVLASVMWARPARELRSQVLSVRERASVQASRSMGASLFHVARAYAVPALAPIAAAQFATAVGSAILLEASLSFLGLGDPTAPSWGTVLFFAQNRSAFLTDAWSWWVLPPGLAITGSVLSCTFLALGAERRQGDRRPTGTALDSNAVELVADDQWGSDAVLSASDLTVAYGTDPETVAVDHVDLTVGREEVLAVVGESGCGKSTLARSFLGLIGSPGRVTAGEIRLRTDSETAATAPLADVRGDEIGFVPQEAMNALDPRRRLHAQVVTAIQTHRSPGTEAASHDAHDLLESVGLDRESHDRYPHALSGGMRQRGALAIAVANDPSVLVVDEPTTGLDVVTTLEVLDALADLQDRCDLAVVLVSHDLAAVSHLADRVAVMREGAILEVGDVGPLRRNPDHPYTADLFAARPALPTGGTPAVELRTGAGESIPVIAYDGITKSHDGEQVIAGVDLSLEPRESVALVGESGAGKSTLARMAAGLERPDEGTVRIDGEPVSDLQVTDARALGRRIHYVFQDPYASLPRDRRVGWAVQEPLAIQNVGDAAERDARAREALSAVGLTPVTDYAERYPSSLSGGERQRVALARALVLGPSVIVADEPTSMLDAPLRRDLLALLYDLVEDRDIALLHVTHDIASAGAFADRIAVLAAGTIVEQGPPGVILTDPTHEQTRRLAEAATSLSGPRRDDPQIASSN